MGIGLSLILVAAGAILTWAVSAEASGIDLNTVGVILMVVGIVGAGQPGGEPLDGGLELGVGVGEGLELLGDPGQRDLLVAPALLELLDAAVGEGLDPFLGAVVDPDHLAVIDVVGIGADDLDEFAVLADPPGDLIESMDMRDAGHQAASADRPSGWFQFHGSNSG